MSVTLTRLKLEACSSLGRIVAIPRLAVKGLSGINRRGRSAVMSRRDADLPLECLTECGPGLVTDAHCDLFNIIFALTQQLAGFQHPPLPDVLERCDTSHLRKPHSEARPRQSDIRSQFRNRPRVSRFLVNQREGLSELGVHQGAQNSGMFIAGVSLFDLPRNKRAQYLNEKYVGKPRHDDLRAGDVRRQLGSQEL